MRLNKLNKNAYVLETVDLSYALYLNGELIAVSNSVGDIMIDEEITERALNTVDQFVELLSNDNPLVFEIPKELLKTVISINHSITSDLSYAPVFYLDWRD